MCILLIHPCPDPGYEPLASTSPEEDLRCTPFDDAGALLCALRDVHDPIIDLVVLDAGDRIEAGCGAHAPALLAALEQLPVPWIEVQRGQGASLDDWLHPQHAPLAIIRDCGAHDRYILPLAVARRCAAMHA